MAISVPVLLNAIEEIEVGNEGIVVSFFLFKPSHRKTAPSQPPVAKVDVNRGWNAMQLTG
jgi:hypothetical protein